MNVPGRDARCGTMDVDHCNLTHGIGCITTPINVVEYRVEVSIHAQMALKLELACGDRFNEQLHQYRGISWLRTRL